MCILLFRSKREVKSSMAISPLCNSISCLEVCGTQGISKSPYRVGSEPGSAVLFPNIDDVLEFVNCNGFWKMNESPSGYKPLSEEGVVIETVVAEVATAPDIAVWGRFVEMALASFVFGTTSGYSLLVVLPDDI
jgi:hypothetical protein